MTEVFEYALFVLICACSVREVFLASAIRSEWQVQLLHLLQAHRSWLEHVGNSRREGTLGPLRLEARAGRLCVVGLGQCRQVRSVTQGLDLINQLKGQIAGLFAE